MRGIDFAKGAINGIQEVAEDGVVAAASNLEQDGALGVNNGVSHLEVQVGLRTGVFGGIGGRGAVDEVQFGSSALGDLGGSQLEELVEVLLSKDVVDGLKNAHGVGDVGQLAGRDAVDGLDALGGDDGVADIQGG